MWFCFFQVMFKQKELCIFNSAINQTYFMFVKQNVLYISLNSLQQFVVFRKFGILISTENKGLWLFMTLA